MSTTTDDTIIGLTADIVAAYVTKNPIEAADLPVLVRNIYAGLRATSEPVQAATPELEPAVPVKRSIFRDVIVCLDCGERLSLLKRHLMTEHELSPDRYRTRWGLPHTYPMVAPSYARRRSDLAKSFGLGHKPEPPPLSVEGVVVQQSRRRSAGGRARAHDAETGQTGVYISKANCMNFVTSPKSRAHQSDIVIPHWIRFPLPTLELRGISQWLNV